MPMKRKFILISLFFPLIFGMITAQDLPVQVLVSGEWIKTWLVCGPFPLSDSKDLSQSGNHLIGFETDFLKTRGGENNLILKAGDVVRYARSSGKCVLYTTPDSIIDFDKVIPKISPSVAYAYTEIESDQSKLWFIAFGTRDGGRLWVNGVPVWDYIPARGLVTDNDVLPIYLKKGKNSLLFKVEKRRSYLQMCARILPFSTIKLTERGELFRVTTRENGEAGLTSRYTDPVLQQLIQNMDLEIFDHQKNSVLKDLNIRAFNAKFKLDSTRFQPYTANLTIHLSNGKTIQQNIPFYAGKWIEYTLFTDKKTSYRIALDTDASESEQWAARELQHWLYKISGAFFPIHTINQRHRGPQIILGYNNIVKEKTNMPVPEYNDESFHYLNSGPDLYIFGGKERGTMYGVMAFLENELGCRWYTPSVSVIPERNEMKFCFVEHSESPGIRVRNDFYFEAFDPIWAARNRMNGRMTFQQQPGGVESYWAVHTFFRLVPPSEFYASHPEYYSLIDGKRVYERAQLCLSNPEVLNIVVERIKKRMRESPEYLIYDVSQNDWRNPCQCDKCQSIVKQEGSESGIIIWFVNKVAEAVEEEFPNKFIGTLAYQYTRTPPKIIRPRENVVVRLCPIEACVSHTLESCPQNQSFLEDLRGWSSIAPHLYIWDYVVNFAHYIMPYPNFYVLQPNIKLFQENNAIGIMEQAAYQSRGGEFSELKSYLISRLLWNPDCNVEKVINDFIYGYYGKAGQYVRQYFDLVNNQITPETHMHIRLTPEDILFSDDFVQQSCHIFENAEKVAENEEILRRVEMASLPVLYLKCKRTPVVAVYDGTYEKFSRIAKRENITHYAEYNETIDSFNSEIENAK